MSIRKAYYRLIGKQYIESTAITKSSKAADKKAKERLDNLIANNKKAKIQIGDLVCYLASPSEIMGANADVQRPAFDKAVVRSKPKHGLVQIEQDKKFIWVRPELLKKLE